MTFNLTNNSIKVEVPNPSSIKRFSLSYDDSNYISFIFIPGGPYLIYVDDAKAKYASVQSLYNVTLHRWWHFRNAGNVIYWETSPDGTAWTTQHTIAVPFPITNLTVTYPSGSSVPIPPQPTGSNITSIWANDGGTKVTKDDQSGAKINSVWDGKKISLFGAKNEVVSFNLFLDAAGTPAQNVSVSFNKLFGAGKSNIGSTPATGDGVFNWTQRNIELFYVKYLQVTGLSLLSYEHYDERHIPEKMRRPFTGEGYGSGTWTDRPNHDKYYPEIAVPLELVPTFKIESHQNQSIWVDVYIPKDTNAGIYTGTVSISENGKVTHTVPVQLTVRNFALPDVPSSKTMVNLGYTDIAKRYTNVAYPNSGTPEDKTTQLVRDRHFQVAHRHKISLIDSNEGASAWDVDAPRPEWVSRLNGSLFTPAKGYNGPGIGTPNNVFSIGTFGTWSWKNGTKQDMWTHCDAWESWFEKNAPSVLRFLYLADESTNYAQTEQWASWMKLSTGQLDSFATLNWPNAATSCPSLEIATSWFTVGDTKTWQSAHDALETRPYNGIFLYNGKRPANGSFATEDDGVSLRQLPWAQLKKGVDRWFFWESTYYNDFQGGRGQTNVFQTAQTFGGSPTQDPVLGMTSWNHSNGDGVLFYPGTDKVYPEESYGVLGPFASLRLKHWRRGIQDVDYITLAMIMDPTATQEIVNRMVPKVLWEYGIADPKDPTWVRTDISWSTNPDDWEKARAELADIIEGK